MRRLKGRRQPGAESKMTSAKMTHGKSNSWQTCLMAERTLEAIHQISIPNTGYRRINIITETFFQRLPKVYTSFSVASSDTFKIPYKSSLVISSFVDILLQDSSENVKTFFFVFFLSTSQKSPTQKSSATGVYIGRTKCFRKVFE